MPRTEAQYATGSYLQDLQARWAPLYEQRIGLLGATTTICPMGDPYYGKLNAATFLSQYGSSGQAATWTPSAALASLATPFKIPDEIAGLVPAVTPAATEEIHGADADYWSRVAAAFSIIVYVNVTNTTDRRILMSKYATSNREWIFEVDASDLLRLGLWDESAAVESYRVSDAAITMGAWVQLAVTQSGAGGGTAAAGITLYQNGASIASTATETVGFVNMENLTVGPYIWDAQNVATAIFVGKMAGGPLGPAFVQAALTADTIRRDYDMCRPLLPY